MNIPKDFKEFIELLNENKVEYLIVGGYAVGFHSQPKFTQDIDFWIRNNEKNIDKLLRVLTEFGFADLNIKAEDLKENDTILQLGVPPMRIDILTGVSGLEFNDAFERRVCGIYHGVPAQFISIPDLINNKKASGRKKDLQDIDWIKRYGKVKD